MLTGPTVTMCLNIAMFEIMEIQQVLSLYTFRRASTLENVGASSSYMLEERLTRRINLERTIWLVNGHASP